MEAQEQKSGFILVCGRCEVRGFPRKWVTWGTIQQCFCKLIRKSLIFPCQSLLCVYFLYFPGLCSLFPFPPPPPSPQKTWGGKYKNSGGFPPGEFKSFPPKKLPQLRMRRSPESTRGFRMRRVERDQDQGQNQKPGWESNPGPEPGEVVLEDSLQKNRISIFNKSHPFSTELSRSLPSSSQRKFM